MASLSADKLGNALIQFIGHEKNAPERVINWLRLDGVG